MGIKARLKFSILLNFLITLAEIIGGILSNSLALLSDSVHNLSDSLNLVASYIAIKIGERERNEKYTFGYKRAEVIVAFINAFVLVGIALFLILEAIKRFKSPSEIKGLLMLIVASIGLLANFVSVLLLHHHSKEDMNIESAYLHLLTDTLSSVAVVVGGIIIMVWGIYWIDPLITVLVSLYILRRVFNILKRSIDILMEASPRLNFDEIKREIESINGVKDAHHFHAWRVGEKEIHFECHVSTEDMSVSSAQSIIDEIEKKLQKYGIVHVTVQIECDRCVDRNIIPKRDSNLK